MTDQATPLPPDDGKVGVTIDGRSLRVPKGTLVLDAAADAGIHIPIYCAHPKMEPVAVCRMCLVHVEKMPKQQPACATYVADGMVVTTNSEAVAKTREGVLEFLLLNHPLDCPVCDRGGECDLQDFAVRYGPPTSRFPITEKVHAKKAVALSEKIELDQERCILCWRCVRYYDEITGEKEIVLQERGVHTVVDTFNEQELRSDFQGNLPEVCPVGALTHRQYRFQARPWDLQRTKTVCPECSYGCNINADSRDFQMLRFASRDNPLVDDMWLCDRGRYSATSWNDVDRVRRPRVHPRAFEGRDVTVQEAIREAASQLREVREKHGPAAVAVLGSVESTNEELWLLQRLAREVLGTGNIDHQLESFEGLSPEEHTLGIAQIEECDAVVVLGDEAEREAPVLRLRLHKAQTKHGVTVHRVTDRDSEKRAADAVAGSKLVGVIADETRRGELSSFSKGLRGPRVLQMTVTRGVNGRGAKDMGMLPDSGPGYRSVTAGKGGRQILDGIEAGSIKGLLVVGGEHLLREAMSDGLRSALGKLETLVAVETRPSAVSESATVLIPGHAFLEKSGTVTNLEGRVQRIRPALPPATSMPAQTRVLAMLAAELGSKGWEGDPLRVSREIAEAIPAYAAAGSAGRALFNGEKVAS